MDILATTLFATLSGAESFDEVHRFAVEQESWLKKVLPLANGISSADTIVRDFSMLSPKAFAAVVTDWLAKACDATGANHIAIDGKLVRGARELRFRAGCNW